MNWLKENWFKLGIFISIIIIALSFFYYYVIFLPKKEEAVVARQETMRLANEQKEKDAQEAELLKESNNRIAQSNCLSSAYENYKNNWATACKTTAKSLAEGYQNCLKNLDKDYCWSTWKYDSSPNCSLSQVIATRLDSNYEKDKSACFNLYAN